LSSGRKEFAVSATLPGNSSTLAADRSASGLGVEECWMQVEGARMRYLRTGAGPALILLHGLLGYSFSWRFTMPALAPYATVYAPDLLGTGFSERPVGLDCSMRATAGRLLEFIAQLGISSFDLVGTSHGGAVATMAAAECLNGESALRLRRLVLVDPVNPYSAHGRRLAPFFGTPVGSALFRLILERTTLLYRPLLRHLYGDPKKIAPGTLEGYMAPLAVSGLLQHAIDIARTWTADLRELEVTLAKLQPGNLPTLLIWGSDDPAVYASSAGPLAKHFPNSKVVVFPGVGHLPYEECPKEFNRVLIEFLRETPAGN
jgi:pimeloyl-ACP methyl ester carboxylesterase